MVGDFGPVTVVGLCGATASGKTRFVGELRKRIDPRQMAHLAHDSYYHGVHSFPSHLAGTMNFDHPDSLDTALYIEHVHALKSGKAIEQPIYDFATHCRGSGSIRIEPKPVVMLEGILIFKSDELRSLMDIKVFIDAEDDLRLARRLLRDMRERGRSPESALEQYLTTVRPMHKQFVEQTKQHADLIIPSNGDTSVGVDILATKINAVIAQANGAA